MKYRFYPLADKAQDSIWAYTLDTWGKTQAEKYIRDLHAHLTRLADNKNLWRQLPQELAAPLDVDIQIYISLYRHHIIFFCELSDSVIGVMSILHEKMNLPVRLSEDLKKIIDGYD